MSTHTEAAKVGHTPGPWKAWFNEDHETHDVIAGSSLICDLPAWERSAANARLIAAAPELLEALKSVRELLSVDTGFGPTGLDSRALGNIIYQLRGDIAEASKVINAAIAKAEGNA